MKKKSAKLESIETIADAAQRDEDVSKHFTGKYQAKQRVNVDFPLKLLKMIDEEQVTAISGDRLIVKSVHDFFPKHIGLCHPRHNVLSDDGGWNGSHRG